MIILLQRYTNRYCPQESKLLQEYFCRYNKYLPPFLRINPVGFMDQLHSASKVFKEKIHITLNSFYK